MTERRVRELGDKVAIRFFTPEQEPLGAFGPAASAAVREMIEARGIELNTATMVHQEDGVMVLTPGDGRVEPGVVVALPTMEGPRLAGLPADELGFIPIDDHARVRGIDDVYAAGDGTNFPIKQGGLATQQADAAASEIAHRLAPAVEPELFARCFGASSSPGRPPCTCGPPLPEAVVKESPPSTACGGRRTR